MAKQFKHVLVLFIEITNCQTMKANESRMGYEKRIQNLIKQIKALSTWVMNFDPIDYMNSADAANTKIIERMQEQNFKDFTERVFSDMNFKRGPATSPPSKPTGGATSRVSQRATLSTARNNDDLTNVSLNESLQYHQQRPLLQTVSLKKRSQMNNTQKGGFFSPRMVGQHNKGMSLALGKNFVEAKMKKRDHQTQIESSEQAALITPHRSVIFGDPFNQS